MKQNFLPTLEENDVFPPPEDNDNEKQQLLTPKMAVDMLGAINTLTPPKRRKTKSLFCFKLLTLIGLSWIVGGGYLFSSSVKIVKKQQVGYYTNTNSEKIYEPGIYFEIPWSNNKFFTINRNKDRFEVKKVTGKTQDEMYFFIEFIQIYYNVTRLDIYIKKIKQEIVLKKFKKYLAIQVSNNIVTLLKNKLSTSTIDITSLVLLPPHQFGISINRIVSTRLFIMSNPNFLQKIINIEQMLLDPQFRTNSGEIESFVDFPETFPNATHNSTDDNDDQK